MTPPLAKSATGSQNHRLFPNASQMLPKCRGGEIFISLVISLLIFDRASFRAHCKFLAIVFSFAHHPAHIHHLSEERIMRKVPRRLTAAIALCFVVISYRYRNEVFAFFRPVNAAEPSSSQLPPLQRLAP